MGGVNLIEHAAGWLEGGLTASFEKLIVDAEMLQLMRETMAPLPVRDEDLGLEAIAEVGPGAISSAPPIPSNNSRRRSTHRCCLTGAISRPGRIRRR